MVLFLIRTGALLTGRWSCPGDPSVVNMLWVCTHGLYYYYVTCFFIFLICMYAHVIACLTFVLHFVARFCDSLGFDVQSNVL